MRSRGIIIGLILLIVIAFGLLAAAKLRATPKYDRIIVGEPANLSFSAAGSGIALTASPPSGAGSQIQLGVTKAGGGIVESAVRLSMAFETDEGLITIDCATKGNGPVVVTDKRITRRGPLERLLWLAGWQSPMPRSMPSPPPITPAPMPPPSANESPEQP